MEKGIPPPSPKNSTNLMVLRAVSSIEVFFFASFCFPTSQPVRSTLHSGIIVAKPCRELFEPTQQTGQTAHPLLAPRAERGAMGTPRQRSLFLPCFSFLSTHCSAGHTTGIPSAHLSPNSWMLKTK